jgi:hypothetical protein
MTPRPVGIEKHEQVGRAITVVFTIIALRLGRPSGDRLAHLADQLCRTFVKANHRALRIRRFGVKIEHILHPRDIGAIDLRNAPHVPLPRLQIVLGEAPSHRFTRQPLMFGQSDHRASQQIQRPSLASLRRVGAGGGDQQRRLLAREIAGRPRTGLLAEWQVQVALHEAVLGSVDRRSANREAAGDHLVADPGVGSQQDLRPLDFARRMFAAIE